MQSIGNAQQQTQLQELHNNFIQDNTFINIGQVITTTLSEIAKTQSNIVNQRITPTQAKAKAKNVIGLVLHDALSNLSIRVTCAATTDGGTKYPIVQLHM